MCPDILLLYSLERVNIPSGYKMFRSLLRLPAIITLYVHLFWLIKIRFFQVDYDDRDERFLNHHLSAAYSSVMHFVTERAKAEYEKDFVFRYLPFILSNAVHFGFYYLCPGSRHMLSRGFRKACLTLVMQFMFGMKISPLSLKVVWMQIFPDDTADDDEDQEEFKPLNANNDMLQVGLSAASVHEDERFMTSSVSKCSRPNSPCVEVAFTPYGAVRNRSHLQESRSDNSLSFDPQLTEIDLLSIQSSVTTKKPEKKVLLRQKTKRMNLQSLSPLMRNHYAASSHRLEKSVQVLRLTNPVSNCRVGGSDTFRRRIIPSLSDDISRYEKHSFETFVSFIDCRRNVEIHTRFEQIGYESFRNQKMAVKMVNKQCEDVLASSKKISYLSLDLMRKKPKGFLKQESITEEISSSIT